MSICGMCGGSTASPNYAKTVDPPHQPYGSVLGDSKQCQKKGAQGNACIPIQMCLPQLTSQPTRGGGGCCPKASVMVPKEPCKQCPQMYCEPCPPPPPTKVWLIKTSPMPPKSFAIAQPPPCNPCSRPIIIPCRPY